MPSIESPFPSSARRPRRRLVAIGVAAVLALGLVATACGSDSSASGSSSTSSTNPTRTTNLTDVKVTGEFDTKPKVEFATAFVGASEEHLVLIPGSGEEIKAGQRVTVDYVAINGNDGNELDSTYGKTKQRIILEDGSLLKPVYDAIVGQRVGVRVLASANLNDRLGAWGLFVFDVVATSTVPTSATGAPVTPDPSLPVVTIKDGVPTIATPTGDAPKTLIAQVLVKGTGPVITAGQTVLMQYTGMIWATGKVFDSSWSSGAVEFPVGTGQVIDGFDEGLVGQTVGSRVLLVIPPDKGYGSDGNTQAGINGTDTLVFVVDLLAAD